MTPPEEQHHDDDLAQALRWREQMEARLLAAEVRLARLEAQTDLMVKRVEREEQHSGGAQTYTK